MTHLASGPSEALTGLFSPAGRQDPYPLYESLRADGPVLALDPQMTLVLGYDECCSALRHPALGVTDAAFHRQAGTLAHSSWRYLAQTAMFSNEPDRARRRLLTHPAYTARRVAELRPTVLRRARLLTRRLARADRGGPVDLVESFTAPLSMAVTGELLGIPEPDRMGLWDAVLAITTAFEPVATDGELRGADLGMDVLAGYLGDLARERRARPRGDLISGMVRDADGLCTEDEMIASLVLLLSAGAMTADLIASVTRLALAHPGLAAAMTGDPGVAADFVTEALRIDPPVQARTRVAATDLDFYGTPVPAGSRLLLSLAAANHDPRRFRAPGRFDISRQGSPPLTGGSGPRYGPEAFARMQAELVVPQLLREFPRLAPAGPPEYRDQLMLRGLARLDVRLR